MYWINLSNESCVCLIAALAFSSVDEFITPSNVFVYTMLLSKVKVRRYVRRWDQRNNIVDEIIINLRLHIPVLSASYYKNQRQILHNTQFQTFHFRINHMADKWLSLVDSLLASIACLFSWYHKYKSQVSMVMFIGIEKDQRSAWLHTFHKTFKSHT